MDIEARLSSPLSGLLRGECIDKLFGSSVLRRTVSMEMEEHRKENFSRTLNYNQSSPISIVRCLFFDCSNYEGCGGAISVNSTDLATDVVINASGFRDCFSVIDGGAVYAEIKTFTMDRTCFWNCSCSGRGLTFVCRSDEIATISNVDLSETRSEFGSCITLVFSLKSSHSCVNYSNIDCDMGSHIYSSLAEMVNIVVANVQCDYFVSYRQSAVLMRFCDFVNNSLDISLLLLNNTKVSLQESVFKGFVGEMATYIAGGVSSCRIAGCVFDAPQEMMNLTDITVRRCRFAISNATLYNGIPLNTDFCWLGQATWDISSISFSMSGASIAFQCIYLVIFVMYCLMKGRLKAIRPNQENEGGRKSSEWSEDEEIEEIHEVEAEAEDDEIRIEGAPDEKGKSEEKL
jgi:hypothetical protein